MRKLVMVAGLVATAATLASCGGSKNRGGVFAGRAPDEFAVARQQPLVIPPDFALVPPRPGAPRPQEADSSALALQAMFGGTAPRSAGENQVLGEAGGARAEAGIRSSATDDGTTVVNKGNTTQSILAAPAGQGQDATVSQPQTTPTPR